MLVIFDCDGVLVDSEYLAAEVFSKQLALEGIPFSAQECLTEFKGRTLKDCLQWICGNFNLQLSDGFLAGLKHATKEAFNGCLRPVENVLSVLQYLDTNNIEYCVASNGGHDKILHSLGIVDFEVFFPSYRRFSAQDVARGKPSPELFLYAAESLGVPPEFCYVIEDSYSGVQAAQAAGMPVLGFSLSGHRPNNVEPLMTFNCMLELLAVLKTLRR